MIRKLAQISGVLVAVALAVLFLSPRPPDTTEARVLASDGAEIDYCDPPVLDGSGALAADIPKAYTPGCGWESWPMPVLARCSEPLAEGVVDIRGLWRSTQPADIDHVERIEQCGNRTVVTTGGVIHDFVTDGTVANGSRDIESPSCANTWVAVEWLDGVQQYRPFGLPFVAVTRKLEETTRGDELVWNYPRVGEVHMQRICEVPAEHRG